MRHNLSILISVLLLIGLTGCQVRDDVIAVDGSAGPLVIYPDYKDVTVPANIAPLNYR